MSSKLREKWNAWYDETINIDMYIQTMVNELETLGQTRTQAVYVIVEDHKDLKGFSVRSIYRSLPEQSKRAYNSKDKDDSTETKLQNKNLPNDTFSSDLQETTQNDEKFTTNNVNIPPRSETVIEVQTIDTEKDAKAKAINKLEKIGYDFSEDQDQDQNSLLEQINILNHRLDSSEKVLKLKDEEITSLQRQLKALDDSLSDYINRNRELEKTIQDQLKVEQTQTQTNKDYLLELENEDLKAKIVELQKSVRIKESVFVNDQEIPLKIYYSPLTKQATVELDEEEVKRLKKK